VAGFSTEGLNTVIIHVGLYTVSNE